MSLIQQSIILTAQNQLLSQYTYQSLATFWIRVVLGDYCPSSGLRVGLHGMNFVCTRHVKHPECYILSL